MLYLLPTPAHWPRPNTDYEAEALLFCRAWQSGQSTFVLSTSGSTGTPKPIPLTRAQMQASAYLTGQTFGLKPGDAALVCLNIRYIAGVMMLVRGLELGLAMTIVEPAGNPLIGFDPDKTSFALAAFVPLQLQTILEKTPEVLPILNRMKAILVGGAATSPALEKALQVIQAPVYATYGMTETVSHIAVRRLNGPEATDYFTALDGVELGTDDRGCLHIKAAATNFERVQTNDVVEWIAGGESFQRFRILGRADSIINSGGIKIQPETIERIAQEVLAGMSKAPRLFVAGLPDERLGQRVVVFLEGLTLEAGEWQRIRESIQSQLSSYHVPKDLITVEHFAETATGKIDKYAVVGTFLSGKDVP